jgi:hypothetical protein
MAPQGARHTCTEHQHMTDCRTHEQMLHAAAKQLGCGWDNTCWWLRS